MVFKYFLFVFLVLRSVLSLWRTKWIVLGRSRFISVRVVFRVAVVSLVVGTKWSQVRAGIGYQVEMQEWGVWGGREAKMGWDIRYEAEMQGFEREVDIRGVGGARVQSSVVFSVSAYVSQLFMQVVVLVKEEVGSVCGFLCVYVFFCYLVFICFRFCFYVSCFFGVVLWSIF